MSEPVTLFEFDFPYRVGKSVKLRLVKTAFVDNGRLAFVCFTVPSGEPYGRLSVNIPEVELGPDEFVADAGLSRPILNHLDCFVATGRGCRSGFNVYDIYKYVPAAPEPT